jgi:hypothetical protein
MSLSNDQASAYGVSTGTPAEPATAPAPAGPDGATISTGGDPAAELDATARRPVDELGRAPYPNAPEQDGAIENAIAALVGVALEMDDPVTALEEGAESLAEALTAREIAAQDQHRSAQERQVDEQAAYRHARFHRVAELIDTGYSLDHAIAITNANEAEIRARAVATGRDPMEPIYRYAVLNGYQGVRPERSGHVTRYQHAAVERPSSAMEALAQLNDEAFAEATKGDRWQRLMGR